MNVHFNQQELQALFQLIDLGVKAGGLSVATAAAHFQQKFNDALQQEQKVGEPDLKVVE